VDAIRSIRGRRTGPKTWPAWALPNWLVAFIAVVVLADAACFAVAASTVAIHARDLGLFAGLLACSAATVELTRRAGENTGFVKDVHATWELPVAMLLPLAVTSTAGWVRRLGFVKWQRLHRLIYFAALAGVIHYYWLVKSDVRLPLMYGAILTVLMLYRFFVVWKQAPKRAPVTGSATTPNTASLPDS